MQRPIYLDYNASTPIAAEVLSAMTPFLEDHFGNPSSRHWAAAQASEAIGIARSQVADLLGCQPTEIVFTSGGSEANNLALKGVLLTPDRRGHVITSAIEHPAVVAPCRFLGQFGVGVTTVPVDRTGLVDPDDIRRAIQPDTRLITIIHANNEVGTIEPIAEIGRIAREHGILLHTDAAQSVGKISTRVDQLGVDLLTVAGHKLYAPKGIGALYVRQGVVLEPLIHGAGHEQGRRAGTENTPYIVALGAASALAKVWIERRREIEQLRDYLWTRLGEAFGERVRLNGHPTLRLPNTLNVSFVGRAGGDVLAGLTDVAASTGSACHSGRVELSSVLAAMRVPTDIGLGAIRFSLGRDTTREELDCVVDRLRQILPRSDVDAALSPPPKGR